MADKLLTSWAVIRSKYLKLRYQTIDVDWELEPKIIELHGDKICDTYNWLEEDTEKRDRVLAFEEYTIQKYLTLNACKNDWLKVKKIFGTSTDYKFFSDVQYRHWYMFYNYMDFSNGIFKPIYYRAKSLKDLDPQVVLDSNKITGTVIGHEYSPNGEYCAFTISQENLPSFVQVINVETGEAFGRSLKFQRFYKRIVWSGDSEGFFIYYDPRGGDNRSLFYHYIDKRKHKHDIFITAIKRAETHTSSFQISTDYKYLILRESRVVSIANVESLDVKVQFNLIFRIFPDVTYEYVGNDDGEFIFLTNLDAPKHHLIGVNINQENREWNSYEVIVAENQDKHGVLRSAFKYGAYLFLIYIENFQSSFYLFSMEKKCIEFQIDLQDEKFISTNIDEFGFYFQTESYETPQKIYKIDFYQLINRPKQEHVYTMLKPILKRRSQVPNLSDVKFQIQHDSFYSFDGSNVPLTVIQKKNDGQNKPCLVFAYGGYGIPMLPFFKLFYLLFIELFNGIVVIIHIRGGGELGDDWLLKSSEAETSFNDLIVGTEYLRTQAYKHIVDTSRIAFHGASHGGTAGAVAINKRRDLFRAVILQNANVDLICELPTKGRIWAKQYGDLNKKADYENIKRYAPLLHIQEPTSHAEAYPSTLLVASRNDNIVSISNSLKYLALRRATSVCNEFVKDKPIVLKTINSGGHHYESAEKCEFFDVVFTKLRFLAQAMDMKFDKKYQKDA